MSPYFFAVAAYLAMLAGAALWLSRRAPTADDMFVAGRTLPAAALACTLLSTWVGAGTLFAGVGLAYRAGLPAVWQAAGVWCGIAIAFALAGRVRARFAITVPEMLERRYGPAARTAASLVTAVAYATIAAYQFRAGGRLLELGGGIDAVAGAAIVAAFCVTFAASAGMTAVARLDVVNALTMLTGVGLALVYLVGRAGGAGAALAALRPDQLTVFGVLSPREALGLFVPGLVLLLGDASVFQKFSAARDERTARTAVAAWLGGTLVLESLLIGLGMLGVAVLPNLAAGESDSILVRIGVEVLPTALGMLLLAGAMAVVVSAATSMLLAAASTLVHDVGGRLTARSADGTVVRGLRGAIVAIGAAVFIAGVVSPSLLATSLWAYTMYAAGVTPALVAALLWPRVTREAGLWSMCAGFAVAVVWEATGLARGSAIAPEYAFAVQPIVPAVLASLATLVTMTLRTPAVSAWTQPS